MEFKSINQGSDILEGLGFSIDKIVPQLDDHKSFELKLNEYVHINAYVSSADGLGVWCSLYVHGLTIHGDHLGLLDSKPIINDTEELMYLILKAKREFKEHTPEPNIEAYTVLMNGRRYKKTAKQLANLRRLGRDYKVVCRHHKPLIIR